MNKRQFIREFSSSPIKFYDEMGELLYRGKIQDVSVGGVLAVLFDLGEAESFEPGEEITFSLDLPSGHVAGIAEIVWVHGDEMRLGLKFKKILKGATNLADFVQNGFLKISDDNAG